MIIAIELNNFMELEHAYYGLSYKRDATGKFMPRWRIQITGDQGTGKTRLRNALIFAFTGRHLSGDTRPHTLISEAAKECSVSVKGENGFSLTRSIDKTLRVTKTTCSYRNAPFIQDTSEYRKNVGYSSQMFFAATIPGYFMAQDSIIQDKIFGEHLLNKGRSELTIFKIQKAFHYDLCTPDLKTTYKDFTSEQKNLADFDLCVMFQEALNSIVNPNRFIFWDDANLSRWPDLMLPKGVQLFVTHKIPGTNLNMIF